MKYLTELSLLLCILGFGQEAMRLNLEEAKAYAVENSYATRSAQLDINKAKEKIWETKATGLPQVSANVDYNYFIQQPVSLLPAEAFDPLGQLRSIEEFYDIDAFQTQPLPPAPDGFVPVVFGTKQTLTAGATLSQLLFSGSYLVGLQSAKAFLKISELGKEKTEMAIREAVTNSYAAVLVAQENEQILQKNLGVSEKNLKEIQAIYKEGLTEEQNVDQLNYTYQSIKSSLNFAKRQTQAAKNSLKFILGVPQENQLTLTTKFDELVTENNAVVLKPSEPEEHIDYKLAENQVKTSELQVKFQKTFALPTLTTFLNSNYQGNSNSFTFLNRNQAWFNTTVWGVSLQVPIFSSFQRRSQTEQAKIDLDLAKINREQTLADLRRQVANSRIEFDNALENLETTESLVELSGSILKKEQIKFREGISSSTELTTAENQYYSSQNQNIQAAFQLIQAKTQLQKALGIL